MKRQEQSEKALYGQQTVDQHIFGTLHAVEGFCDLILCIIIIYFLFRLCLEKRHDNIEIWVDCGDC